MRRWRRWSVEDRFESSFTGVHRGEVTRHWTRSGARDTTRFLGRFLKPRDGKFSLVVVDSRGIYEDEEICRS